MSDDDLIARVRAVVQNEAGPADGALAERLLHGTARARRARRAGALTLAAVVLAGAGFAGASLRAGGDEDSTLRIQAAGDPPPAGHPEMAGAVTVEQAARKGLDGTAQCNAFAARDAGPVAGDVTTRLRLTAAYLTDTNGLEAWTREYSGGYTTWTVPPPIETLAICWYVGDVAVPPDISVNPTTVTLTHQLVAVHVGDPSESSPLRLDMRSAKPYPVLAPPVPAGTPANAPLRAFPQPDGVPVIKRLPPGLTPLPPKPGETQRGLPPFPPGPDRGQQATPHN